MLFLNNFSVQSAKAQELHEFIYEEFVDVMTRRGHKVTYAGDEILLDII